MRGAWILAVSMATLTLVAACGGSGAAPLTPPSTDTGVVEGYLSQGDIVERAASAVDGPICGASVWCEDPGSGQMLGQDTTDLDGHYRIDSLPAERELRLRFRYRAEGESTDVEGEAQIRLRARQQLEFNARIRLRDTDGDGEPDAVDGEESRLQVRLRNRNGQAEEDAPE